MSVHFLKRKLHAHPNVSAEYPVDLDVQELNSAYPCDRSDTYFAQRAQSGQKSEHVDYLSKMQNSENRNFELGSTVLSVRYNSA